MPDNAKNPGRKAAVPPGATRRAQPESLRGRSLQASLTVADIQQSLAWYRDVLGFAIDQRYERDGALMAVSLRAGVVRVLISQDDGAKGGDRTRGEAISLMLTTVQDIDETAQRISAAGGTIEAPPADTPWGTRMFRLRDPDGFRYTISSER